MKISKTKNPLMHTATPIQDLDHQWKQNFIQSLIQCSIKTRYFKNIETLSKTSHTNKSQINTLCFYVVKTLEEGNNPLPQPNIYLRQYIMQKKRNVTINFSQSIIEKMTLHALQIEIMNQSGVKLQINSHQDRGGDELLNHSMSRTYLENFIT